MEVDELTSEAVSDLQAVAKDTVECLLDEVAKDDPSNSVQTKTPAAEVSSEKLILNDSADILMVNGDAHSPEPEVDEKSPDTQNEATPLNGGGSNFKGVDSAIIIDLEESNMVNGDISHSADGCAEEASSDTSTPEQRSRDATASADDSPKPDHDESGVHSAEQSTHNSRDESMDTEESTPSKRVVDLSATISQLAARVSCNGKTDDHDDDAKQGIDDDDDDDMNDCSMDDDDQDSSQPKVIELEEEKIQSPNPSPPPDISATTLVHATALTNGDSSPSPLMVASPLSTAKLNPSSGLTKAQINAIIEEKFQTYVKSLCRTDELETRFTHLEELTENLRKRHREQEKTLMKCERTSRASERKTGCRHVACQTNLGGGSLMAAQKMSRTGGGPVSNRQPTNNASPFGANRQPPGGPTAGNKRASQEVVDLTDEDTASPAVKRNSTSNPPNSQPNNATFQHLLASGAAKVVNPSPKAGNAMPPGNHPLRSVTNQQPGFAPGSQPTISQSARGRHPAPLPSQPVLMVLGAKLPPPQPFLKIEVVNLQQTRGVMLSWDIQGDVLNCAKIVKYQLYAYQETNVMPTTSLWKKIGDDVAAMPLPMACTLSHFLSGHNYHFAVRAIDEHSRIGPFSKPESIFLA